MSTHRLLMIEDDARLAAMVGEYLTQSGYAVTHTGDGEAGLEALRRDRFDLVVLDLMLPDIDGLEVCRRIRALPDGAARVPVVPAACIYDLGFTGNARHPGADEGYAACMAAVEGPHECGSVGAGTGATLGKLRAADGWCKGGVGAAAVRTHDGVSFAALAVVNAWGDVIDADGSVIAGAVGEDGRFVSAAARVLTHPPDHPRLRAPANTTLVCIATDGRLTKTEAAQVARMAHAGMARAVSPVHTPFDGDLAVCLAAGRRPVSPFVAGVAAAEVAAGAIRDAAGRARSLRGVPTGAERRASAGCGAVRLTAMMGGGPEGGL